MRVLLIEDDIHYAELLGDMYLAKSGHDVERVGLLGDAINKAGEYDTILLDLKLPNSHGADTVKAVAERFGDTPIIVITGDTRRETILEAHRNGARDYIPKDRLTVERLAQSITDALASIMRIRKAKEITRSIDNMGIADGRA